MAITETAKSEFAALVEYHCAPLFDSVPGLYGLMFATADGESQWARLRQGMEAERLAAMSSSLVALSETIAKAAEQHQSEFAIVQNSDGYVVSLRVGPRFLLSAFARRDTNLGMLLSSCRNAADQASRHIAAREDN